MNDDAAPTPEFGTGLRARLARVDDTHARAPLPSSRDLVDLLEAPAPVERSTPELVLVAADLSRYGTPGPVAA